MEIIQALPEERQYEFMKLVVSYALGNEVNDTDMQPIERVAFIPISQAIDKERETINRLLGSNETSIR